MLSRLVNLLVEPPVAPIGVGEDVGDDVVVVEGGVEIALRRWIGFNLHFAQGLSPFLRRLLARSLEVPARHFRVEVPAGALDVDGRDADFYQQGIAVFEVKQKSRFGQAVCFYFGKWFGETGHEIDVLLPGPGSRDARAFDLRIAHHAKAVAEQAVAVRQVEEHVGLLFDLVKNIAVQAHALGGRQFGLHLGVFEVNGVIARLCRFRIFPKQRPVPRLPVGAVVKTQFARARHQQHIAVIRHPGATEVGMAEAVDVFIREVVTRAAVPTLEPCVGTQLYQAEGRSSAGVGMPVPPRSDEGVDGLKRGELGFGGRASAKKHTEKRPK